MEKKIDQYSDFNGFSIKNLQQSIVFWRFLSAKNYFARSLSLNRQITEKRRDRGELKKWALPQVYLINDETCEPFEEFTRNSIDSNVLLPKLFLTDNSEVATRIKKTLLSIGQPKRGVLPSINLLSNFETYQANRPIDIGSEVMTSNSKRLIDLIDKIPFLDDHFSNKSLSSFELASNWLKIIDRWEWLEEGWRILGSPLIKEQEDNFDLGSLEFLFLLKNALYDKSNPALWHSRQFKLALNNQPKKKQSVDSYSGVVMVLTELPDPLTLAKALILARQKISSWKIFLINYPLAFDSKKDFKSCKLFRAWKKNFPLIWPEAFKFKDENNVPQENIGFEKRRKESLDNCKLILKEHQKKPESLPLRCIEVKSLESMTEILTLEIKTLLNKKVSKIGIIALDRRATRRLIAKLDQFKIDVNDGAGWSLNTSVVSLSIIILIKIISKKITVDDFYYWLKIPLVFKALTSNNFLTSDNYKKLISRVKSCKVANNIFKLLPVDLKKLLTNNNFDSLEKNLITTLEKIGMEHELLSDPAGQVALKVCRKLEVSLIGKPVSYDYFINLVEWEFSNSKFSLKPLDTAIKLINLQQALWNPPDAIIVIGATSQYMPNVVIPKFVEPVLWEKALAQFSKKQIELFRLKIFISILKLQIPITLVGQLQENKGSTSWSRWVERIRLMLPGELEKKIFSKFVISHRKKISENSPKPYPSVYLKDYPESISVSDIKSLIECPYKFFWLNFFGLKKTDYFGNNSEYRDTGIGLHLLMERIGNFSAGASIHSKSKFTEKDWVNFFNSNINLMRKHKLISWETALNLRAKISPLSKWCESFFYASSPLMIEKKISARLPKLPVLIKGKVDRVEQKNDKEKTTILIDFKSSKVVGLNNELQKAQILIYTWLLDVNDTHITEAGYLCVTNKETKWLKVEQTLTQKNLINKLSLALLSLNSGHQVKPIAAISGHVCQKCSVRNACRKDEWMLNNSLW